MIIATILFATFVVAVGAAMVKACEWHQLYGAVPEAVRWSARGKPRYPASPLD
jgi:hypothetical protein